MANKCNDYVVMPNEKVEMRQNLPEFKRVLLTSDPIVSCIDIACSLIKVNEGP